MGFVFTYFGDQQEIRGLACLIYRAGSYIASISNVAFSLWNY